MLRNGNLLTRLGSVVVLLLASLFIPWWATMILAGIYALLFRWFLEGVLVGWLLDATFMATGVPWVTIALLVYVIAVEVVVYYISH